MLFFCAGNLDLLAGNLNLLRLNGDLQLPHLTEFDLLRRAENRLLYCDFSVVFPSLELDLFLLRSFDLDWLIQDLFDLSLDREHCLRDLDRDLVFLLCLEYERLREC
ncbi:hypothetical protein NDU88_001888 [Pleurodeles waltl]|uniref:Uncharacterized protein n=1 Tax=Pleurodeles waltl TaxID=8319 RepID=A0AAV7UVZ4_PLEWA|nr:hypothetical protein NDU88_001888 [Pleurodeles waltl]